MCTQFNEQSEKAPDAEVGIIGGGLTGLTTSITLQTLERERGLEPSRIVIVEADDVLGGRIKSINHGGVIVNTGAQWFHSGEENPFYQWVTGRYSSLSFSQDKFEHDINFKNGKPEGAALDGCQTVRAHPLGAGCPGG